MGKINFYAVAYVCFILALFSFVGIVSYKSWFLGSSQDNYGIVCIRGHEYYRANFMAKGFLAIRLDDDGYPVRCMAK